MANSIDHGARTERGNRARGCMMGQLIGDALGSQVEFQSADQIARAYPGGVRELRNGGYWNTLAGQPTDDSEMALELARTLVEHGRYDAESAREGYKRWFASDPFDYGRTTQLGLSGRPDPSSQANGALMRISPLGIFGSRHDLPEVARWAREDAAITHPHPVCVQANSLFAMAIASAVSSNRSGEEIYRLIVDWAVQSRVDPALMRAIEGAASSPPIDYQQQMGWVLIALRNALWQLLHAPSLEEALVDTVGRGGDTDTNAAICGALLGSVYGIGAMPSRWIEPVLACRPAAGAPDVHRARPERYWPVDALELADRLAM